MEKSFSPTKDVKIFNFTHVLVNSFLNIIRAVGKTFEIRDEEKKTDEAHVWRRNFVKLISCD